MSPTIALLTDFGLQDAFVGIMKGVMLSRLLTPVPLVDITHGIPPQDIRQAAWELEGAIPYFPPQTIFLCVVDPRVGHPDQKKLLVTWPERSQYFIAPDNGLVTPVLQMAGPNATAHAIANEAFFGPISRTFHGRDIYAPTAALLANALMAERVDTFLSVLGPVIEPIRLDWPGPRRQESRLHGYVIAVDTYGNLITNIPGDWLPAGSAVALENPVLGRLETRHTGCYAQGQELNQPFVVTSSRDTLEISLYGDSAARQLHVTAGMPITVHILQTPGSLGGTR